ncbi:MAG: endolytic transglycosylase MltG, partial [Bacteroidota bacterium]
MKVLGRLLLLASLILCLVYTVITYLLPVAWQLGIPKDQGVQIIHIPTGSSLTDIAHLLKREINLIDVEDFLQVAQDQQLEPRPGRFSIPDGLKYEEIVDFLANGKQTPVRLIINNKRTPVDLAHYVEQHLELTAQELLEAMNDPGYTQELGGYDTLNIMAAVIPNTYEFFWNTNARQFLFRMAKESQLFWNDSRLKKAQKIGLDTKEVFTLASIVEKETNYKPEKDRIAGVYLNRLNKKGWKLQADPTVIYAWQDFTIRRVLRKHTQLDSP